MQVLQKELKFVYHGITKERVFVICIFLKALISSAKTLQNRINRILEPASRQRGCILDKYINIGECLPVNRCGPFSRTVSKTTKGHRAILTQTIYDVCHSSRNIIRM